MKRSFIVVLVVLATALGGGSVWYFGKRARPAAASLPASAAIPVVAATVTGRNVPIYLRGIGTVIAYNTDVVRSQIQGQIVQIAFTEGQTVKAGDLLAQIDPRPYEAQIEQFTANRDRDRAQLTNAEANLSRYTQLGDKGYATPQLIETQKAQVAQLQAAVKSDQAQIDEAKVQLSYTRLTSPIPGVTGVRQIDVGNVIHPTDPNGLVVVTQVEPISLLFTLPEADLPEIQQQLTKGPLKVVAYSQDDKIKLDEGELLLINNEIIQTTGTLQLKATFPNRDHRLWPGQLINARLLLDTRKDALTVAGSAVQQGPNGAYVYVVKPNQTAELRPVHVAQISDGQALIDQGLKSGDVVVIDGQYRLKEGSQVQELHGKAAREATCKALCRTRCHEFLRALHLTADRNRPADGRPAAVRPCGLSPASGRGVAQRQLPDHSDLAQLPGADPQTIASSVATPLEQQLSQIPGVTQLTSSSALGVAQLTVQFELSRTVDSAAVDVLSAINAASPYLPPNIPYPPTIRKVNPAETPIMLIALSSDTLPMTTVDAYAENILLPKISQVPGVGLVGIGGQQKPAIRVQVNPQALADRGIGLEDVRSVIAGANVDLPKGTLNSPRVTYTLNTNDQLLKPAAYDDLIIAYRNGSPVRIRDIGTAIEGPENNLLAGWYGKQPAIILAVQRVPGANVIETVDRIRTLLPTLQRRCPPQSRSRLPQTGPRPFAPPSRTSSSP